MVKYRITKKGVIFLVRNKAKNFPGPRKIEDPKAKTENASKRANGEINTNPQDRMIGKDELE
jgi:small acid-soluble spore protein K (minor)